MTRLDPTQQQKVTYCIPLWQRDEQIKASILRVKARIEPVVEERTEPIAVVCYGPSLNDTWEKVKDFKYIITGSGSHKFLVERGIIPTWHVEVDPRPHKVELIGTPHRDVEYLIASTCHAKVFDLLEGFNVKLWHVFANEDEAIQVLPRGEWALTGGSNVGLRQMTISRFLGFLDLHVFGMDGCEGVSGKHAAAHPNQPKDSAIAEYGGVEYKTTPAMSECARQTFHELNQMPRVKATFYGEGLVQAMAKDYKPQPVEEGKALIGYNKPKLISDEYMELNKRLHRDNLSYGVGGGKHAAHVVELVEMLRRQSLKDLEKLKAAKAIPAPAKGDPVTVQSVVEVEPKALTPSVLDYGCGKGYLAQKLPFPIWEYDPAIPGKDQIPRPADLVVCADVLEHVEADHLLFVLDDLRRCTKRLGYFVIHTGPSTKILADGRNSHLIQKDAEWWKNKLSKFFMLLPNSIMERPPLLYVMVAPKNFKKHYESKT